MAKLCFKKESDFFQEAILDRQEKISIDYTRYFSTKPTFVTYYSKNHKYSTAESSLDDTVGLIGRDSPIKFNRIDDLPIFEFEGTENISLEETDHGLNSEVTGSGIIIPRMIEPMEEDFFYVKHEKENYLFRVNEVEEDKISGEKFYKISFSIIQQQKEELEDQVVKEYIVNYDNIGTEYKPVIETAFQELLTTLVSTQGSIIAFIKEYFYHESLNFLKFKQGLEWIFDPVATKIVMDYELLERLDKKDILNSIYLDQLEMGGLKNVLINEPLKNKLNYFNLLISQTKVKDEEKIVCCFSTIHNPFANELNFIYSNELGYEGYTFFVAAYAGYIDDNRFLPLDIEEHIISNELYTEENTKFNFLIKYFNNELTESNFVEYLEEIELDDTLVDFFICISLLFIIKKFYNKILTF
jgi:hypothetical protein